MSPNSSSASTSPRRYVIVGMGGRSRLFSNAIIKSHADHAELVAVADINPQRVAYALEHLHTVNPEATHRVRGYAAADFDLMLRESKADAVIVCTMDRTHHEYIIRALDLGCDVISEKPMTTDIAKCEAILDAVARSGRDLKVTFNYRYAPSRTKVKELLQAGTIGKVLSVHFEWLLDTYHGADYFRRWHRDKRNSGGLMVHKATHHFDLVNWWLDTTPELVFGFGNLGFYGRANAEQRGDYRPYFRATGSEAAAGDPFAINLRDGGYMENLYLKAEAFDGYIRDQNVFGDGISIEDTMNVLVRYRNGAQMSYSLTAFSPWEGLRIAFNGTAGRIELTEVERPYINAGGPGENEGASESQSLTLQHHWKEATQVAIEVATGGHGGGDERMLDDIFLPSTQPDPYRRAANHFDGALSILTGLAANESFATGRPVAPRNLLDIANWKNAGSHGQSFVAPM